MQSDNKKSRPISGEIQLNVEQILNEFKDKVNISRNTRMKVIDRTDETDGSQRLSVAYVGEYPIKTPDFDGDILVSTPLSAELHLDKEKELFEYHIREPDPDTIDALKKNVGAVLEDKGVGREFFIQKDEQGRQHLKRSHFSIS
jgi:hypothetical protein